MIVFVLSMTVIFAGFVSCSKEKTEEEKLQDFIAQVGEDVEAEDMGRVLGYLDENFEDFEGRDVSEAEEMIDKYFTRYKQIAFNLLASKVLFIDGNRAEMEVEISLSSGAAKAFRKLIKFSGECYRFKLTLARPMGEWKISYAEWRYMPLDQLFPESFKILKEVFPNI